VLDKCYSDKNIILTEYPGHATELAEQISDSDNTIVAVGGDGTIHEVLNGIMRRPAGDRSSIAVFPAGSANDFATAQGIEQSLKDDVDSLRSRLIDVGIIRNSMSQEFFINVADAGFGAEVVKSLTSKRFLGPSFSYFRAITSTFLRYKPVRMSVESEDFSWTGKAYGVFTANSSQLGSGIVIDRNAKIDDGIFTVFIVGELTGIEYLLQISRLRNGKPPRNKKIQSFECSELTISAESDCSIEADGELIGQLPVTIRVEPEAIRLCSLYG
jgi:YegS/Rv2252/BmrU family lipid kinase